MEFDQCPLSESSEVLDIADKDEKYSLRHRQRRQPSRAKAQTIAKEPTTGRVTKEKKKPKAPPLSKYRRKTANARERTRMREINTAFENLRSCVPSAISCGAPDNQPANEKLTKITTLRLAMKYIRTLNEVLSSPYSDAASLLFNDIMDSKNETPAQNHNNNSISHNFNSNSKTKSNNNNKNEVNNNGKTKKRSAKKSTATATVTTATIKRAANKTTKPKRNAKKATVEPASMPTPIEENPIDLGLMLESDGESLHLSEPCLSPLAQTIKPFNCGLTANGTLELGMFLESDNDSLEFSEQCLSPLGAFDVLSPFGDLLSHAGFSEQSSLDMYLT